MKKIIQLLLSILFIIFSASCQAQVYPGDVNNNGSVDNMDFIYLCSVFGETGPARDDIDCGWEPHDYTPWNKTFKNSYKDIAHADCNGDGIINEDDVGAINLNSPFENSPPPPFPYSEGIAGVDPSFDLSYTSRRVEGGTEIELSVASNGHIEKYKRMAFTLEFDSDVDINTISDNYDIDYSESWVNSDGLGLEYAQTNESNNNLQIGIARINGWGPAKSGEGKIVKIKFIIIDNVIELMPVFNVKIKDAYIKTKTQRVGVTYDEIEINANPPDCGIILSCYFFNSSMIQFFFSPDADSWTWDFGDGQTSNELEPIHTFNNPGTYTITLTTSDGCLQYMGVIIEPEAPDPEITVYPNPTTDGMVYFDIGNATVSYIQVWTQGVHFLNLDGAANHFDLSGYISGYYYFNFIDHNGTTIKSVSVYNY